MQPAVRLTGYALPEGWCEAIERVIEEYSAPLRQGEIYYLQCLLKAVADSTLAGPKLAAAMKLFGFPAMFEGQVGDTVTDFEEYLRIGQAMRLAIDADDEIKELTERLEEKPKKRADRKNEIASKKIGSDDILTVSPFALSFPDAAKFLGVGLPTIVHLVKTRKLAFIQVGDQRGRCVLIEDLIAFARDRRQPTGEEIRKKKKRQV